MIIIIIKGNIIRQARQGIGFLVLFSMFVCEICSRIQMFSCAKYKKEVLTPFSYKIMTNCKEQHHSLILKLS
ncbi:hypothetical protein NC651_013963 [Populus alba x Populus x berolinensis]|nr:hypothetical protein NC651_013963 [Populus alba x Populus x berolinensis]